MITLFIIGLNVLLSLYGWNNPGVISKNSFAPYFIRKNNEWHRFITSGFFHSDWGHLFFNMFSFFFFAQAVESYFERYNGSGSFYMLMLYFTGLIVSDVGTYFKQQKNSRYESIGASGAVSAVVFSGIWFAPTSKIYVMFFPMPGFLFGALYLLYTAWSANNQRSDYINHDAHFYGSVWGVIFTLLVEPKTLDVFFYQLTHFQLF